MIAYTFKIRSSAKQMIGSRHAAACDEYNNALFKESRIDITCREKSITRVEKLAAHSREDRTSTHVLIPRRKGISSISTSTSADVFDCCKTRM